jgi:putative ABC transport system permease protein
VLGVLAATTGGLLATVANVLLARFVFKSPVIFSPLLLLASIVSSVVVTLAAGLLTHRGITKHPPLEVLRQET